MRRSPGSPIGSGQGVLNPNAIHIIRELVTVPVIVFTKGGGLWLPELVDVLVIPVAAVADRSAAIFPDGGTHCRPVLDGDLEGALIAARIIAYAQGFAVLQAASEQFDWGSTGRAWPRSGARAVSSAPTC